MTWRFVTLADNSREPLDPRCIRSIELRHQGRVRCAAFSPDGHTVAPGGDPGTTDQFGLKVTNPSGAGVSDLTYAPLTLNGGNFQVPQGNK